MLADLIQIITTTAEKLDAQNLAQLLHENGVAACTQIVGPLESSYRWNNRVETSREWQLTIKTRRDLYVEVETLLLEHHPYDQPEIVAVPVLAVSEGYLGWLETQLAGRPRVPASQLPATAAPQAVQPATAAPTTTSPSTPGPSSPGEKKA